MSSVIISGDTSGSVTLLAPTAAGSTTLTLPAVSGTVVLSNSSDQIINGLTVGKGSGAQTNNTIIGSGALAVNTTGNYLTGFGVASLQLNTTGQQSVAIGFQASQNNTTGSYNTSVGVQALQANTTASGNTAVGYKALYTSTTAANNTAVGLQAGLSATTGYENVFIGANAGNIVTTGIRNTIVGNVAGSSLTTGSNNTFVGANGTSGGCGEAMTTGSRNTIIGGFTGNQGGIDIRTSNNRIVISDGDGNPRGYFDSSGTFYAGGFSPSANGTGGISSTTIGNGNQCFTGWNTDVSGTRYLAYFGVNSTFLNVGAITSNGSTTSYVTTSDYRLKENVAPMVGALETVSKLKPVTYRWKESGIEDNGFIAHELQEVLPNAVVGEKDAVNEDGSIDPQAIDTSFLVATLTAAIQELNAKVIELEAKLESK